jgi:hypothetical protein
MIYDGGVLNSTIPRRVLRYSRRQLTIQLHNFFANPYGFARVHTHT